MKILEFIISFLVQTFMLYVMLHCYKNIFNKNLKLNYKKCILISIFSICIIINNLYCIIFFRLIVAIFLNIFLNKMIFNDNIADTVKYTLIYFIISFLIEILLASVFTVLKLEDITNFNKSFIIKNLFSFIEATCVLAIFSYKKVIKFINKLLLTTKSKFNYTYIVTILILYLNIITIFLTSNLNNKHIVFLSASSIIFIILSIKVVINDKYNIIKLRNLNNNLKNSYRAYAKTIEDYKTLKHNLRNELYGIKTSLPKVHQTKIDKLIANNNKDLDWVTKLNEIPEGLQGIIFLKKEEAKKKKVNLYINSSKKISVDDIDYLILCDIVGIILDNAIEATSNQKHKIISVNINETKKSLTIEIINIFNNSIDLNNIGKKNYSTKKIKSGLGLNYIKNIKNNKIKIDYKIINNLFIVNITYMLKQKQHQ